MAVTLSSLALNLRVITEPGQTVEEPYNTVLSSLLAWAEETVDLQSSGAPSATRDLAIYQLCGYVYDKPQSAQGQAYANAWLNSGASNILRNYIQRRAIDLGGASGTPGTGTATPGTGGTVSDEVILRLIRQELRPALDAETDLVREFLNNEITNRNAAIDSAIQEHARLTAGMGGGGPGGLNILREQPDDNGLGTRSGVITLPHRKLQTADTANGFLQDKKLFNTGFVIDIDNDRVVHGVLQISNQLAFRRFFFDVQELKEAIGDRVPTDGIVANDFENTANSIRINAGSLTLFVSVANGILFLGSSDSQQIYDMTVLRYTSAEPEPDDQGDLTPTTGELTGGLSTQRYRWIIPIISNPGSPVRYRAFSTTWEEVPSVRFGPAAKFINVTILTPTNDFYEVPIEVESLLLTDDHSVGSSASGVTYQVHEDKLQSGIAEIFQLEFSWRNAGTAQVPDYRLLIRAYVTSTRGNIQFAKEIITNVISGGNQGGILPAGSNVNNQLAWVGNSWQAVSDEMTVYYALINKPGISWTKVLLVEGLSYFLNNVSGYQLADNTRPYAINRGFGQNFFRMEDLWLWGNVDGLRASIWALIILPARYIEWIEGFRILYKADPDKFTIVPTEAGSDYVFNPALSSIPGGGGTSGAITIGRGRGDALTIGGVEYRTYGIRLPVAARPSTKYQVSMVYTAPTESEIVVE